MSILDYFVKGDMFLIGDYMYSYDVGALNMATSAGVSCVFRADEDAKLTVAIDLNQEVEVSAYGERSYMTANVLFGNCPETVEIYVFRVVNVLEEM